MYFQMLRLLLLLVHLGLGKSLDISIGKVHYEESYHLLHGTLDVDLLKTALSTIETNLMKFGNRTINRRSHPISHEIEQQIGLSLKTRTLRLAEKLNTATFTVNDKERGIDFIGNFLETLTGNVGPYTHEKEAKSIEHMKMAMSGQSKLNKLLNRDMHNMFTKIEREEIIVTSLNTQFNHFYTKIQSKTDDTMAALHLLAMSMRVTTLLDKVEDRIDNYHFILIEAKSHMLSNIMVNATSLKTKIKQISADSRTMSPVIPYKQSSGYYTIPTTRAVLLFKKIHLFTRVPMIRPAQSLTLYPVDYAASKIENFDFHFIMVDKKNTFFSTMTQRQFEKCLDIQNIGFVTDNRPVEILMNIGNCTHHICAMKLCHVTQLRHETFSFKAPEICTASIYCKKNNTNEQMTLPMKGIFTLSDDCSLRTKYFYIHSIALSGTSEVFNYDVPLKLQNLESLFTYEEVHSEKIALLNTSIETLNQTDFETQQSIINIEDNTNAIETEFGTHKHISIGAMSLSIIAVSGLLLLVGYAFITRKKLKKYKHRTMAMGDLIDRAERDRAGID